MRIDTLDASHWGVHFYLKGMDCAYSCFIVHSEKYMFNALEGP
jgi:hypothetical protein